MSPAPFTIVQYFPASPPVSFTFRGSMYSRHFPARPFTLFIGLLSASILLQLSPAIFLSLADRIINRLTDVTEQCEIIVTGGQDEIRKWKLIKREIKLQEIFK